MLKPEGVWPSVCRLGARREAPEAVVALSERCGGLAVGALHMSRAAHRACSLRCQRSSLIWCHLIPLPRA